MEMKFRMVEMQIMNIVNRGMKNRIDINIIEELAHATIDATQLFLSNGQIETLRMQLSERLEKQKIIV